MHISELKKDLLYYLASPYTTPKLDGEDPRLTRQRRAAEIECIGASLIEMGFLLIEPISMCHVKSSIYNLPQDFQYWKRRDLAYIDRCDAIIVAGMDRWWESVGVSEEMNHALKSNKPVFILDIESGHFTVYSKNNVIDDSKLYFLAADYFESNSSTDNIDIDVSAEK